MVPTMRRPLIVAVLALALAGCGGGITTPAPAAATPAALVAVTPAPAAPTPDRALDALGLLPVKGRAPKTGYSRDQFGPTWGDADRNQCDTRNDMLKRDLTGETFKPGTHDCVVLTGKLADPYSATDIDFLRGARTSNLVQIDHVVPLSDAWQKGAQQLSAEQRYALANDPANLQATGGKLNESKGDGDAATWLPPSVRYRCTYVARIVTVKIKYRLWVTQPEHDAIATILSSCPDQPIITEVAAA